MRNIVKVKRHDDVYDKIECDAGIAYEISDFFTFTVPGYQFTPAYKNKIWDGKFRLFNPMVQLLYVGLQQQLKIFCEERNYEFEITYDNSSDELSINEIKDFIKTINLPEKLVPRDYQLQAFAHAIRNRRALLISPTASGKSLIIYLIQQYLNKKTLLIVPTVGLVGQMYTDFKDYGFDSDNNIHMITAGVDKKTDKRITISTWQSIYKMPKKWFDQFDVVLGDEAHLFKAKSLTSIMSKLTDCKYKIGFTGTLDGEHVNKLVLMGLFGDVKIVSKTSDLIKEGYLADFKIKSIVLRYDDEVKKQSCKLDYQSEIQFIIDNDKRNNFIKNLVLSLDGNVLVLFSRRDHGTKLLNMIKQNTSRPVYFIDGTVKGEERNDIRQIINKEPEAILVASVGTTSTGTNIVNLKHLIFATPSKSRVRVMQSIGRVLRKSKSKVSAILYDLADDLSWKSKKNHTLKHFVQRINMYDEEKFTYKIYTVRVKNEKS